MDIGFCLEMVLTFHHLSSGVPPDLRSSLVSMLRALGACIYKDCAMLSEDWEGLEGLHLCLIDISSTSLAQTYSVG